MTKNLSVICKRWRFSLLSFFSYISRAQSTLEEWHIAGLTLNCTSCERNPTPGEDREDPQSAFCWLSGFINGLTPITPAVGKRGSGGGLPLSNTSAPTNTREGGGVTVGAHWHTLASGPSAFFFLSLQFMIKQRQPQGARRKTTEPPVTRKEKRKKSTVPLHQASRRRHTCSATFKTSASVLHDLWHKREREGERQSVISPALKLSPPFDHSVWENGGSTCCKYQSVREWCSLLRQADIPGAPRNAAPAQKGRAEVGAVREGGTVGGREVVERALAVGGPPASSLSASPHIHSAPHMV